MSRTGRRAEMSAFLPGRKPLRHGVCADCTRKSDEGSREGTDEASDEGSRDALRIRVSFGRPPFPSPGGYREVGVASTNVPRHLCEGAALAVASADHV